MVIRSIRSRPRPAKGLKLSLIFWRGRWSAIKNLRKSMRRALLKQTKRIVLKIGSGIIASRDQGLDTSRIEQLAKEVAQIREAGHQILLVSSGAILSGLKKLGL